MEFWDILRPIIISFVFAIIFCIWRDRPKKIIVESDNGWLKVSDHSIPENEYVLVSDMKVVKATYDISYNKKGQPVYCDRIITHWQPYPEPPKD